MPAPLAIWALTPNGVNLMQRLTRHLAPIDSFVSSRLAQGSAETYTFTRLRQAVSKNFTRYSGHIFIMATGIVVRTIAAHLAHKTRDPAVVVVDEAGQFAISLVGGHLGGANALALKVAQVICSQAVITTATDLNQVPAIDLLAKEKNLRIENPDAIKSVNMAFVTGNPITLYDPYKQINDQAWPKPPHVIDPNSTETQIISAFSTTGAGICIDDRLRPELGHTVLVLRPPTLVVGMGCNRNAPAAEMQKLLETVLKKFNLAMDSIGRLATIDLKSDEPGLVHLARQLNLDLTVFTPTQLKQVEHVPTPSAMVKKHIGVNSVCEAAAILGARSGNLIVPKHKSANVTLAIARLDYTLSASVRAVPSISHNGP